MFYVVSSARRSFNVVILPNMTLCFHKYSSMLCRLVFHYKFFFSIVASEQKNLPQAEFHCFYIMFLNDSCSKTMIYTNKSNWQPRYYFFQFIRKLFLFFYVLFANYQIFFTSNNIIQIFYLYIFFLLCHIRLLLKLILVFITKKY